MSQGYFNAAGASEDSGSIGEDHDPETHLIPLAIDAAVGKRPSLSLFGTDYPTPDGTCLRDYVHVDDLEAGPISQPSSFSNRRERSFSTILAPVSRLQTGRWSVRSRR